MFYGATFGGFPFPDLFKEFFAPQFNPFGLPGRRELFFHHQLGCDACVVQTGTHCLSCQRYIELNLTRAGMINDPADYVWSSYRTHALGRSVKMWQPHSEYIAPGQTRASRPRANRALFSSELDAAVISDIRQALNTGLVPGNDKFRKEIEHPTGQRQRPL